MVLPFSSDAYLGGCMAILVLFLCYTCAFPTVEDVVVETPSISVCSDASSFKKDHFTLLIAA
jgi:hypothetical protein